MGKGVLSDAEGIFKQMLSIGLFGLLFLIIFGNLSGNLGFDAGSQGENDTELVIGNLTSGSVSFFSFMPTIFTLLAITVLILVILTVIRKVNQGLGGGKGGGGFSS